MSVLVFRRFASLKRCKIVCHFLKRDNLRDRECSTDASNIIKSPYCDVHVPNCTLTEFIWKDLNKWSDKIAVQCFETGQCYTYAKLRILCAQFAKSLKKKKCQSGQVIAVLLPNILYYPIVLLGSVEAGLIVTTLNPNFTPAELSRQFEDSGTKVIVTLTSLVGKVELAIKTIEQKSKSTCSINVISIEDENSQFGCTFIDMLNEHHDRTERCESFVPRHLDDVVLLPYSSGTTGFPKGVQLTHANIIANLLQYSHDNVRIPEPASVYSQDVVPAVIPFFHIFGISTLIFSSLVNGCKIITLKKFDPEQYVTLITKGKANILYLVPPLAHFVSSNQTIQSLRLSNIRAAFCAGGHFPVTILEKLMFLSENGMKIRQGYGLTETSPAVCISEDGDVLNTIGHPLSNTRMKIIGQNGETLMCYHRGELCVQGPQIMKGYLNNSEATSEVIDAKGFFHTGDIGYYNDEGKFFCIDRIKELIKVKGFQVAPVELESVILTYRNVKDAAVVGVPDERCGEKPIAFVVTENGKANFETDLKKYVAEHVVPYKQLDRVLFVDSIPRNPSGKILRRNLREQFMNSSA